MDNQQMMALAERVEQAAGPDRELDARIAVAIYSDIGHADQRDNTHARFPSRSDECAPGTYWISAFSGLSLRTAPAYTASLDAAMTLKADDRWGYDLNSEYGNEKAPGSHTYALTGRHFARIYTPDRGSFEAAAATPALALTAAALKARALTPDPHNG